MNARMRPGRALAVIFLLLVFAGPAAADSRSERLGERIAGSYLITHDGTGSRDVLTIGADGTFLMTSSDSFAFQFTNSQGAWKRTRRRSIKAKVVNFDFDDKGVGIVRFDISFDRRYRRITGSFAGTIVGNDVDDPLNADSPVLFSDSFTGQRITAD